MKGFQLKYLMVVLIMTLFAVRIQAQQETTARTSLTVAAVPSGTPSAPSNTLSEPGEREKMLLERIDKLEKRLADLESRTPAKPAGDLAQADANVPTAKPAADSPASAPLLSPGVTQEAANPSKPKKSEPFAFADWSWMTGNARTKDLAVDSKFFTPEIRFDVNYTSSFNHPKDNTIGGSSEIFRSGEVQLTQLGLGGDFHYDNVRGRVMTQIGMYSQTQPRNDVSVARGQWNLDNAYRYISEAYGGYHIDKMHGINVDAGIFLSYIGLWSFYNFDNWTYQPSFVSSNTPWFFNGVRVQIFPSDKLKIEPWFINGWQSYGKFNKAPGIGGQIAWRPNGNVAFVFNNYYGADTLGIPGRKRFHTDDSVQVKYYDKKDKFLDKAAFSFTADAGCENGGGVSCRSSKPGAPAQYFIGFMAYNRFWFKKDKFGLTLGGGAINNPGRYLVLLPPINGATAITGTPYFTENPGDPFKGLDGSVTFDYMPSQYITFRMEYNHRASNVPYYSGKGGVTPPGGNTGPLGSFVPGWAPDLVKQERRYTMAILVKF
jgi:putative OmpL-like beta-barrel porin-2